MASASSCSFFSSAMEAIEEGGYDGYDPFSHLPDETVLHILNKILEAQYVYSCSIVSKRFNSIVPQVQAISLNITPQAVDARHRSLFMKIFRFWLNLLLKLLNKWFNNGILLQIDILLSHVILRRFKELKSLEIKIAPPIKKKEQCFVKWYAVFGTKLVKFVLLSYTEAATHIDDDGDEQAAAANAQMPSDLVCSYMIDAKWRYLFMLSAIEDHPKLENVVIVDSESKGKVYLEESEAHELKELLASTGLRHVCGSCLEFVPRVNVWYKPNLKLPLLGCSMKGVTLTMVGPRKADGAGNDDGELGKKEANALLGDFDVEEDSKFGEVVAELLRDEFQQLS